MNKWEIQKKFGKKLNQVHRPRLDWKLLLLGIILIGFGCLVALIRSSNEGYPQEATFEQSFQNFIVAFLFGIAISLVIYFINYKKIQKYSNFFYGVATLLIFLQINLGIPINGFNYLNLKFVLVNAAIISVPLYLIAFVGFLTSNKDKKFCFKNRFGREKIEISYIFIKTLILSFVSLLLCMLIPSFASSLILGISYLIIATIFLAQNKETRKKQISRLWGITIAFVLGAIVYLVVILGHTYLLDRIVTSFNPKSDEMGGGWLGINRRAIIESAEVYGEAKNKSDAIGIFDQGTNFAFISILAHYGWISAWLIVGVIVLMAIQLIRNSKKIQEIYGKLIVVAISSLFLLQSIFNVCMNLNFGLESSFSLPFVSYGSINLIINMMCLALVLSVYRKKDLVIEENILEIT